LGGIIKQSLRDMERKTLESRAIKVENMRKEVLEISTIALQNVLKKTGGDCAKEIAQFKDDLTNAYEDEL